MRLNNKELKIVIDEIYSQVSEPIIAKNNKLLENAKYDKNDAFLKDVELHKMLTESKKNIEEQISQIESKYTDDVVFENGYECKHKYRNFYSDSIKQYIDYLKQKSCVLAKYPTKDEIEKQIILAENGNISELISKLVEKFKTEK